MTEGQALIEELRSLAEIGQFHGERIRNTCRQSADYIEAAEQELSDFRHEVSDAVGGFMLAFSNGADSLPSISHLIIRKPKPDPLVVALKETYGASLVDADALRAALDAAGFEIREKNDDQ